MYYGDMVIYISITQYHKEQNYYINLSDNQNDRNSITLNRFLEKQTLKEGR
jgi:hypothetical protein